MGDLQGSKNKGHDAVSGCVFLIWGEVWIQEISFRILAELSRFEGLGSSTSSMRGQAKFMRKPIRRIRGNLVDAYAALISPPHVQGAAHQPACIPTMLARCQTP